MAHDVISLTGSFSDELAYKTSLDGLDDKSDTSLDSLDAIEPTEITDNNRITSIIDEYDVTENIFSSYQILELKLREKALFDRNQKDYYRCKISHETIYSAITDAYTSFITRPMLEILNHTYTYTIQRNEALNNSVSVYAQKGVTYSLTESLDIMVAIVASVNILVYLNFWSIIFAEFGVSINASVKDALFDRDYRKMKRAYAAETIEGNTKRSKLKYVEYAKAHATNI